MRSLRPVPRGAVASLLIALLLASGGCAKRVMQYATTAQDSTTSSSGYLGRPSQGGGGGGGDGIHGTRRLVAAQLETNNASRKIVRNGSLDLVVGDVDQAGNKIRGIIDGMGGFVEKSTQTNTGGHAAVMSVRVPAEKLEQTISQIKSMAITVDREEVEARDVTRDYVDLDARLRNAQAEEARYLDILKRATTIKDTLEGAEKLSKVRGRIEQLQGEIKYLTTQIDMSALQISLQAEAGSTVLGIHWRPLRQAKVAVGDMISGLADWADSVIAFFINLPLILLWIASIVALIVVAIRILRFCWRKFGPKTRWRLPWLRNRGAATPE